MNDSDYGRYVLCQCGGRKRSVAHLCRRCREKQHLYDRIAAARAAEDENGCWPWRGSVSADGYGKYGHIGNKAHRVVYEHLVGPIPAGLQIDHLCRNRACVNPAHLEPVTALVNQRRGANVALKKTCKNGHTWVAENILTRSSGKRECRICYRQRVRNRNHERRAA